MGIEQYLDVGKPDDKQKNASVISVITETLRKWAEMVEHYDFDPEWRPSEEVLDELMDEAIQILIPHDKELPDTISDEQYFAPIRLMLRKDCHRFAGLYYTAMLNLGKERTLIIPRKVTDRTTWKYNYWGYKLEKGTIINKNSREWVGEYAGGGLFINEAECIDFGGWAKGGLFINHGLVHAHAEYATGGVFVNLRNTRAFLYTSGKPLILNYGKAKRLYLFPTKRISQNEPKEPFLLYGRILLWEKTIKQDSTLYNMWNELSNSSRQKEWKNVQELAAKIKRHCTLNYRQNI